MSEEECGLPTSTPNRLSLVLRFLDLFSRLLIFGLEARTDLTIPWIERCSFLNTDSAPASAPNLLSLVLRFLDLFSRLPIFGFEARTDLTIPWTEHFEAL